MIAISHKKHDNNKVWSSDQNLLEYVLSCFILVISEIKKEKIITGGVRVRDLDTAYMKIV